MYRVSDSGTDRKMYRVTDSETHRGMYGVRDREVSSKADSRTGREVWSEANNKTNRQLDTVRQTEGRTARCRLTDTMTERFPVIQRTEAQRDVQCDRKGTNRWTEVGPVRHTVG